ncbi:hypothetical protein ACRXCV_00115 (plasmid) [Halobacteriovorax sp. GFR7]|uniref:hypothetical protein n=1 Tax=unclassified Halobacteriovorax TaxID=2639665 RepID=UPI003D97B70F
MNIKEKMNYTKKSNGEVYLVLYVANKDATREGWHPTVVYMGKDGRVWAKPVEYFEERFTLVGEERPDVPDPAELPYHPACSHCGEDWDRWHAENGCPKKDTSISISKACYGTLYVLSGYGAAQLFNDILNALR